MCRLLPFLSAKKHQTIIQFRSAELQLLPGPVLGGRTNTSAKFLVMITSEAETAGGDGSAGKHIERPLAACYQELNL